MTGADSLHLCEVESQHDMMIMVMIMIMGVLGTLGIPDCRDSRCMSARDYALATAGTFPGQIWEIPGT